MFDLNPCCKKITRMKIINNKEKIEKALENTKKVVDFQNNPSDAKEYSKKAIQLRKLLDEAKENRIFYGDQSKFMTKFAELLLGEAIPPEKKDPIPENNTIILVKQTINDARNSFVTEKFCLVEDDMAFPVNSTRHDGFANRENIIDWIYICKKEDIDFFKKVTNFEKIEDKNNQKVWLYRIIFVVLFNKQTKNEHYRFKYYLQGIEIRSRTT